MPLLWCCIAPAADEEIPVPVQPALRELTKAESSAGTCSGKPGQPTQQPRYRTHGAGDTAHAPEHTNSGLPDVEHMGSNVSPAPSGPDDNSKVPNGDSEAQLTPEKDPYAAIFHPNAWQESQLNGPIPSEQVNGQVWDLVCRGVPYPPNEEVRSVTAGAIGIGQYTPGAPTRCPELDELLSVVAGVFGCTCTNLALYFNKCCWLAHTNNMPNGKLLWRIVGCPWNCLVTQPQTVACGELLEDARYHHQPWVQGGLRCYCSAPLMASNGHRLGTVCFLDVAPRKVDAAMCRVLNNFGEIAVRILERHLRLAQRLAEAGQGAHMPRDLDSLAAAASTGAPTRLAGGTEESMTIHGEAEELWPSVHISRGGLPAVAERAARSTAQQAGAAATGGVGGMDRNSPLWTVPHAGTPHSAAGVLKGRPATANGNNGHSYHAGRTDNGSSPADQLLTSLFSRQLRSLSQVADACVLVMDTGRPGWPVLWVDETWCLWAGFPRSSLIGRPLQDVLQSSAPGVAPLNWAALQDEVRAQERFVLPAVVALPPPGCHITSQHTSGGAALLLSTEFCDVERGGMTTLSTRVQDLDPSPPAQHTGAQSPKPGPPAAHPMGAASASSMERVWPASKLLHPALTSHPLAACTEGGSAAAPESVPCAGRGGKECTCGHDNDSAAHGSCATSRHDRSAVPSIGRVDAAGVGAGVVASALDNVKTPHAGTGTATAMTAPAPLAAAVTTGVTVPTGLNSHLTATSASTVGVTPSLGYGHIEVALGQAAQFDASARQTADLQRTAAAEAQGVQLGHEAVGSVPPLSGTHLGGHASASGQGAGVLSGISCASAAALEAGAAPGGRVFDLSFRPMALDVIDRDALPLGVPSWVPMEACQPMLRLYIARLHEAHSLPPPPQPLAPSIKLLARRSCLLGQLAGHLFPGLNIGQVLGRGGYGTAYHGFWYDTQVVVKSQDYELKTYADLRQAQVEVALGQILRHPHLVRTLAHGAAEVPRTAPPPPLQPPRTADTAQRASGTRTPSNGAATGSAGGVTNRATAGDTHAGSSGSTAAAGVSASGSGGVAASGQADGGQAGGEEDSASPQLHLSRWLWDTQDQWDDMGADKWFSHCPPGDTWKRDVAGQLSPSVRQQLPPPTALINATCVAADVASTACGVVGPVKMVVPTAPAPPAVTTPSAAHHSAGLSLFSSNNSQLRASDLMYVPIGLTPGLGDTPAITSEADGQEEAPAEALHGIATPNPDSTLGLGLGLALGDVATPAPCVQYTSGPPPPAFAQAGLFHLSRVEPHTNGVGAAGPTDIGGMGSGGGGGGGAAGAIGSASEMSGNLMSDQLASLIRSGQVHAEKVAAAPLQFSLHLRTLAIQEMCDGGTLLDAIDRGWLRAGPCVITTPPDLVKVLTLTQHVARACAYLHSRGVVHADLSASNVLLRRVRPTVPLQDTPVPLAQGSESPASAPRSGPTSITGGCKGGMYSSANGGGGGGDEMLSAEQAAEVNPAAAAHVRLPVRQYTLNPDKPQHASDMQFVAKVGDFGKCTLLGPEGVVKAGGYATITCQAPEVLRDRLLSPAADVWAAGVLMWQMFTGARPWAGMSHHQILGAVVSGVAQLEWAIHPALPAQQREVAERIAELGAACMHYAPTCRPTMQQLDDQVSALLAQFV